MSSYEREVERGIRHMLQTYEAQKKQWGQARPILIIDDGGMASKVIDKKFAEHIAKFRIVEVTASGYRQTKNFAQKRKRLPLVYYSIAYTAAKKMLTSSFFGKRVAQRVLNLIPQTGEALPNKRVAILGGGPMGLFAGLTLKKQGFDVTYVEPNAKVADKLRERGFAVSTIDKALPGRGLVLGMSGYLSLKASDLKYVADGAFVAQGSSKRQEFEMAKIAGLATAKTLLPRQDGLAQQSYTYTFGRKGKRIHFLGDGWTINHDGSLNGTPMKDIQLELALLFESAVRASETDIYNTGKFRELDAATQALYINEWRHSTSRSARARR